MYTDLRATCISKNKIFVSCGCIFECEFLLLVACFAVSLRSILHIGVLCFIGLEALSSNVLWYANPAKRGLKMHRMSEQP